KGNVRALFVGQITPARARVLRSLGSVDLDRTAPWQAAMARVEALMFHGQEGPPGQSIAPAEARVRLAGGGSGGGAARPASGPIVSWKSQAHELWSCAEAPALTDLALPEGTLGVAWLAGDSFAARGMELEPLIVSEDRLESLSLGLVRGRDLEPWNA